MASVRVHREDSIEGHRCANCGEVSHEQASHLPWGGVWFCEDCWHGVPSGELQRISRRVRELEEAAAMVELAGAILRRQERPSSHGQNHAALAHRGASVDS